MAAGHREAVRQFEVVNDIPLLVKKTALIVGQHDSVAGKIPVVTDPAFQIFKCQIEWSAVLVNLEQAFANRQFLRFQSQGNRQRS